MMKALLAAAGVSLVTAQGTTCLGQNVDNCTATVLPGMPCAVYGGTCSGSCDTSAMTCNATAACSATGTMVMNGKSCSKCASTCGTNTNNVTCFAAMAGGCSWTPQFCYDAPAMMRCGGTTSATCIADAGCFWVTYQDNVCGTMATKSSCSPCDTGAFKDIRSVLNNKKGMTCKWPMATGWTYAYSLNIMAVAQGANATACPAFSTTIDMTADNTALTAAAVKGSFGYQPFDGTPAATCTQNSGSFSLIPSLAVLGLIVAAF